ncbi:iron-siderophore ABC transporter substrate-binding protein [Mycolicibacterium smegmatis]|nr:iron-siderophore ABC transporter substrate-binding protein [Mycolicibacterium smegmatis]ABK71242.1 Periplasmic binding protein [Mycolicibacterium smegmatis MC2 155]AIU05304.1 ABC transporter substrate-binding protein [Mycolicibacterium smegmatis MC2 155]AIU11929.1 ABC transporter substrate-binding protein [Mycolicibacterium smegmatis]AIU18553.1 ABC transporter substrate-binding protein [Mycolicibacterium smegmatis]MBE9616211.1 iron-siderophore ABC transporter substrate-binding protein [Myco
MAPIFAAAVAIGMVSACGSESEPAAESGATTISHKFGETTVPENPSRVVTVGWTDQDFVLPFGVVPVSAREFSENYNDLPWVQEATGGKGIPTWGSDSIDFEAIAAQKPDLILAIYETIDQQTYDRLSQIAPTVIQSADYADEETPWDVQLLTTGKALGKEAEAKELLDEVQGKIDEARRNNPEFEGKTLVVDFGPADGGHYLLGENDPRRSLFTALGFQTQDVVGDVSEEKLDLLDRDVLFVNGATKDELITSPAFERLGVVRDGRTLYTTFESKLSDALTYSGPDSLQYALDVLTPQLANALNGRPVADLSNA